MWSSSKTKQYGVPDPDLSKAIESVDDLREFAISKCEEVLPDLSFLFLSFLEIEGLKNEIEELKEKLPLGELISQ